MKHHLEDKFLITGADTLSPRPCMPHESRAIAIEKATGMVQSATGPDAAIIWAPVAIVSRSLPPVIVRDL